MLVIDIKNKPRENDILIFDGKNWIARDKKILTKPLEEENQNLKQEYAKLLAEFESLKKVVNDKLKDYHNILQKLTKEE